MPAIKRGPLAFLTRGFPGLLAGQKSVSCHDNVGALSRRVVSSGERLEVMVNLTLGFLPVYAVRVESGRRRRTMPG